MATSAVKVVWLSSHSEAPTSSFLLPKDRGIEELLLFLEEQGFNPKEIANKATTSARAMTILTILVWLLAASFQTKPSLALSNASPRRKATTSESPPPLFDRRAAARIALSTTVATVLPTAAAHAFDVRPFPDELSATDTRDETIVRRRRRRSAEGPPGLNSIVWGAALWFLSGSRSNPIATPLANLLYKREQETWLQDRNEGLFAGLPWEFLVILAVVFCGLGYGTDRGVTALVEGDPGLSLQLAGVSLIGGAFTELGRIATGEKQLTRDESDRTEQLESEFTQFAGDRLIPGGNCHRNEVVQAFRRYYAKYRQVDNEEFPLADLEIEQLLRLYCRERNLEMSSAGFYNGIQINQEADVFVQKR